MVQSYLPGGANVPSHGVYWRHLANTTEHVLPSAHPSRRPKRQINWFSRFCTAHSTKSIYFKISTPFSKIAPSDGGSGLHLTRFLGPVRAQTPNGILIGLPFLHRWPQSVPILYNGTPLPLKISPSHVGSGPLSNTWFPGPTRVLNLNDTSIGSAIFCRDHWCDRPTDHTTRSVTMPHLRA